MGIKIRKNHAEEKQKLEREKTKSVGEDRKGWRKIQQSGKNSPAGIIHDNPGTNIVLEDERHPLGAINLIQLLSGSLGDLNLSPKICLVKKMWTEKNEREREREVKKE